MKYETIIDNKVYNVFCTLYLSNKLCNGDFWKYESKLSFLKIFLLRK